MKYKSLFDIWKQSALKYGDKIAFSDNKEECKISYNQAFREICFLAEKFKEYGITRQDHICLFAASNTRWLIIEQGIISSGGVCVSKDSDINMDELDYVYSHSDSVALITDKIEIINHYISKYENFIENAKFILYIGNDDVKFPAGSEIIHFKKILSELNDVTEVNENIGDYPEDICYINYTSGTSSTPKGVMLSNTGMVYVAEQLQYYSNYKEYKTFINTFPLASAGGKSFNVMCISLGCQIIYTSYKDFYDALQKYKPDYLSCAPKIPETMREKFMAKVKEKGFIFEKLFNLSYKFSLILLNFERKYLTDIKTNNSQKHKIAKNINNNIKKILNFYFYKCIKTTILKEDMRLYVGSAALAKPLEDFYHILGINIIQQYGLTETTGIAVSNSKKGQKKRPYTVGIPFTKTTIRIIDPETHELMGPNEVGLITLAGPGITKGYYKNPEATQKAILENGFFNTGDLGYVTEDNYLIVLSRYDDVIVLSNGYNIYTPLLENQIKDSLFINHIIIAGHGKPYLVALIVLNNDTYKKWCVKRKINKKDPNLNEEFKSFLIEDLNERIKNKTEYKYYEKLKKIHFLKEEFTVENGMLTTTMKVKYKKICNIYKKEIENLYKN